MQPIEEYWRHPETNNDNSVKRKLEALELDAKRLVMETKHAHSAAVGARDDYLTELVNTPNPSFSKIVDHCANVAAKAEAFKLASESYQSLFPES